MVKISKKGISGIFEKKLKLPNFLGSQPLKGTSPLAFLVQSCTMNNFLELQLLSMMEFTFNTLPRKFSLASLLKCVSDFTTDVFFVKKGAFQLNISTKKETTKDKDTKISSLK